MTLHGTEDTSSRGTGRWRLMRAPAVRPQATYMRTPNIE